MLQKFGEIMKVRKGDTALVIYGKDRGKKGKVGGVYPKKGMVVVEGVNIVKKHLKARGREKGGIVEITKPLAVSKIKIFCPKCKEAIRVGFDFVGGKKVRICKKCRASINAG